MRFLILMCVVGAALASSSDDFYRFAKHFTKAYKNAGEMAKRRAAFTENYQKMVEHNAKHAAGLVSWKQKVTEDMDLTPEEWMSKRTGGLPYYDNTTVFVDNLDARILAKLKQIKNTPREFNWVDQGAVSSVKNQAQCGSCAAFAAMGAIESATFLKSGVMANDLSEQHILDCAYNHVVNDEAGSWGAYGCDGAWPNAYLDWLIAGEYNQEESAYPYTSGRTGDVTACKPSNNGYNTDFQVSGMFNKWYTPEADMENLVQINPVVTVVLATNNWSSYHSGVLDDNLCCNAATDSSCIYNLNHAVLVVGYGTEAGKDYWLIKNSWGSSWGMSGFLKLKRGTGHCGVGSLSQAIPYL